MKLADLLEDVSEKDLQAFIGKELSCDVERDGYVEFTAHYKIKDIKVDHVFSGEDEPKLDLGNLHDDDLDMADKKPRLSKANLHITLEGLNASRQQELRKARFGGTSDEDKKLKSLWMKTLQQRNTWPKDLAEWYIDGFYHPYGNKNLREALQKLTGWKKIEWSEAGLQTAHSINVDVEF